MRLASEVHVTHSGCASWLCRSGLNSPPFDKLILTFFVHENGTVKQFL